MEAGSWRAPPPKPYGKPSRWNSGPAACGKAAPVLPACPFGKQEMAGAAIALILFQPPSAASDWLSGTRRGGLDTPYGKAKPGRPPKIGPNLYGNVSDMMDGQPVACGILSNVRAGRLIIIMLSVKFGIKGISSGIVCHVMRKMNKAWKLPGRPFDRRMPFDDVKGRFKASRDERLPRPRQGSPHILDRRGPLCRQGQTGERPAGAGAVNNVQDQAVRQEVHLFRRPGGGGHNTHRHYDRGNTEYVMDFVRSIREKYGKALLFMDNTSYHKYRALVKEIETYGGDIRLECLPAYSPDLNPV